MYVFLAVDQMTSISDATHLSSSEMEVLAIHVSESWISLAPMLGVDESNVEKIFDEDKGFLILCKEYSQYFQAAILLYLYNESDHLSRGRLVQSCKKFGTFAVKDILKK